MGVGGGGCGLVLGGWGGGVCVWGGGGGWWLGARLVCHPLRCRVHVVRWSLERSEADGQSTLCVCLPGVAMCVCVCVCVCGAARGGQVQLVPAAVPQFTITFLTELGDVPALNVEYVNFPSGNVGDTVAITACDHLVVQTITTFGTATTNLGGSFKLW